MISEKNNIPKTEVADRCVEPLHNAICTPSATGNETEQCNAQRDADTTAEDGLLSIRSAAAAIGLSASTLLRQVHSGQIRAHGGKVRLSEVLADRACNVDVSQSRRRPKVKGAVPDATATALNDEQTLPFGTARAQKETWLARLRKLEFQIKSGRLVDAELVRNAVFRCSREDRDALMNWPPRVAPIMAAELEVDATTLTILLERHVREHLAGRALRWSLGSAPAPPAGEEPPLAASLDATKPVANACEQT